MSKKKLYLNQIETENHVDMIAKNVWMVVTEDDHILFESDLKSFTGLSNKSENERIAYVQDKVRVRRPDGVEIRGNLQFQLNIYKLRLCHYCDQKIHKTEIISHPPHLVHDRCWPFYLDMHPELKEEEGIWKGEKDEPS